MRAEAELLRSHGHEVRVYERTNAEITRRNTWGKFKAFKNMTWSPEGYKAVASEIDSFKPDVMHVHNYKWLLSPSIFKAAKDRGVATVHTLHNYWMCAPCGTLMRKGVVCEKCLESRNPIYGVWNRCRNKGNLLYSVLGFIYFRSIEKRQKLYNYVDKYIALTEFAKQKFIQSGISSGQIFVKPNFICDPLQDESSIKDEGYALFVGRLSYEKGIHLLLKAWSHIAFPLIVIGDGPMKELLHRNSPPGVCFLGLLSGREVIDRLTKASWFVFPSLLYEGFPMSLLESMAIGKASVASRLGARDNMVEDGVTGLLYDPLNTDDLINKSKWMIEHPDHVKEMGQRARARYLEKYTPDSNYQRLIEIYQQATNR